MALKTVKLGVTNTHRVATGVPPTVRAARSDRLSDSTRPFSASNNSMTLETGSIERTGTYRPKPMPRPHIYIPYVNKVNRNGVM